MNMQTNFLVWTTYGGFCFLFFFLFSERSEKLFGSNKLIFVFFFSITLEKATDTGHSDREQVNFVFKFFWKRLRTRDSSLITTLRAVVRGRGVAVGRTHGFGTERARLVVQVERLRCTRLRHRTCKTSGSSQKKGLLPIGISIFFSQNTPDFQTWSWIFFR